MKLGAFKESFDLAAKIARQAIPLASKYKLPVNPDVYTIFYLHAGNIKPELSAALEKLAQTGEPITQEDILKLHKKYISGEDECALELLRDAIETMLSSTQGVIQKAENDTAAYSESLDSVSDELNQISPDQMDSLVNKLLTETQKINSSSKNLREELFNAHKHIDKLNAEYTRIRHESLTDPLTGLNNRRAFDLEADSLLPKAKEDGSPLCLLVIDIDHFKKVNDTYGHSVGDAVLRLVGSIVKKSVRGSDVPARFGGEEFVVLLPETPIDGGTKAAENIRANIGKQNLTYGNKEIGLITVSVGVSILREGEQREEFFNRADAALYRAKDNGRNQVCVDT